jgi:methionyl aminopeptidase
VFHAQPNVLHFRNDDDLGIMVPGFTFTIEPVIKKGTSEYITWPDDWTLAAQDGLLSCQYEHTLLITKDGVEILTKKFPNSPKYFWELE